LWRARSSRGGPLLALLLALATAPPAAVALTAAESGDPLRVGLIAGEDPWSVSLAAGARAATASLNAAGGIHGRPLILERLEAARPWRDGASRIARLAATEDTVALLGAANGAEAHLAAQVASRLRLPLVTVSPEESLTQAGAVWVFRATAHDHEQARLLLARVPGGAAGRRATLVVPAGREGRERARSVGRACRESGMADVTVLRVATDLPPAPAPDDILLLWLDAGPARLLLDHWGEQGTTALVLGSTRLNHPAFLADLQRRNVILPGGGDDLPQRLGADMINLLAGVLADAGTDPHALRAALAANQSFSGATGNIKFDRHGNRREADPTVALSAER